MVAASARIGVIVPEHPDFVTPERQRSAAVLARSVARLSGATVSTSHYLDASSSLAHLDAVIVTGSYAPWSSHRLDDLEAFGELLKGFSGPVFGICAGMQLLASFAGARVTTSDTEESGFTAVEVDADSELFAGMSGQIEVFEKHTDEVVDVPDSIQVLASNATCSVQALAVPDRRWWGTQFHPELADEEHPDGHVVLASAVRLLVSSSSPGEDASRRSRR